MPIAKTEHHETILVVEDDPMNRKIIAKMLKEAGYAVQTASDGQQGVAVVSQISPALILMDIIMPVLNGIDACRQLKADASTQHIPVIFVTASTDDQTLQAAFNAGGGDYVRKPVSRVELLARVRSALDQQEGRRRLAEDEKLKGALETAGGICHELNQPLQYILGAVQLLMMDITSDEPAHKTLDAIRCRVEQMGEITRKLAEITRYRTRKYAGGHEIIDIHESAEERAENESDASQ